MTIGREQAEKELVGLLEDAIEKVKHIRLDHVEEVTKVFDDALQYLESNLVVDQGSYDSASVLLGKAKDGMIKSSNSGSHYIPKKPISQVAAMKRNVTSDYSSPSLGKRSLGGARGNKPKVSSRARANMGLTRDDDSSGDDDDLSVKKKGLGLGFGGNRNTEIMGKPLKNKNTALNFTRDTSSPSLGVRSLGGAKKTSSRVPGLGLGGGKPSSRGFPSDEPINQVSKFNKTINDPVASPANMAASRNLIDMAAKSSSTSPQEKTPKASYLRRLDSPGSNHAKLIKAREELTTLIHKCLKLVPQMNIEKYHQIKNKFDLALEKLDDGKIVARRPE